MAARSSSLAAKRRLSLDILAATKANEDRIKVWALQNTPEQNGTADNSNLNNGTVRSPASKSSVYARKKKIKVKVGRRDDGGKKNQQIKSEVSEIKLTLSQRYLSWRFLTVLLLQSSFVVAIFLRNCLPMAMVCMVKPRAQSSPAHASNQTDLSAGINVTGFQDLQSVFDNSSFYNNSPHWKEPAYEFDWNSEVQGLVLTSIMFSSFIGPLLVTVIKEKLGSKPTLTIFSLVSTLLTFLCPAAARINPYCLVAVRILMGISLGGNVPVIGDCIAWWAPQDEKLTMVALVFTGVNIGSILASAVSGYLCLVPFDNGWPFVFYTFGSFSLIWCVFWHFLSAQKPEEHRYISEKEKQYIIVHRSGLNQPSGGARAKLPYRQLFSSLPVLAYFATTTCHVWSTQIVFTYLPVYVYKVMKFSVQETGLLISLTSSFRMFGTFIWTVLGNKLVSVVSTNKSRKICICTGFMLGGVTAVIVGFFDHNYKWLVLGLLIVLMVAQSVGSSTISALPLDMAPRYAGLLTGMCVSFASLISISGPLLTAAITPEGTQEEWRTVWIVMGGVFITGFAVFLAFGHASLQPWASGIQAQHPHIISPFVTMGRRFSTFLEAPPLSPVSPRDKSFDFSRNYQSPAANVLAQLATATPDIFYTATYDVGKTIMSDSRLEPTPEHQDSGDTESNENDDDEDDGSEYEESYEEHIKKLRRRAHSESGIEVLRLNLAQEMLSEERGPPFVFVQRNNVVETATVEAIVETHVQTEGIVNKAYDGRDNSHVLLSDETQVSRL